MPSPAIFNPTEPITRACTGCELSKPINEFYKKGNRIESQCKACKMAARRQRYQKGKVTREPPQAPLSRPCVEQPPTKTEPNTSHIEPQRTLSFEFWEGRYGRPLSTSEKLEIRSNLTDFFTLLLENNKA
jgi:hypothetical protein